MTEYTEHVYKEYHGKTYEPLHQREEVVRCRDCKKFDPDFKHDWEEMWWCKGLCHYTPSDGFCSFGKRREV